MIGPQIRSIKFLARSSFRTFSTSTPAAGASPEKVLLDEEEFQISNAFKNQHIVYVPKKKLQFNTVTPDGKMALVFEAADSLDKRAGMWKVALGTTIPAAIMSDYTLSAD
jgi:hypothetical protein